MEEWHIQYKELLSMPEQSYRLIDIRDEASMSYGMIPGAEWLPTETIEQNLDAADKEKKLVLYCTRGALSEECAEVLREKGYDAVSLEGGYTRWLLERMEAEQKKEEEESGEELLRAEEIEKSIRKKFHKRLFSRFAKAVREYELVQEGDRIAVCISGGKDSMLMAKLFQELKKHNKFPFEVEYLVMDPGYSELNRKLIEQNAKMMGIPIKIFESDIFDAVFDVEKSPCYLCARMRRGHLYSKAKELGCNKIALGHHYDDVIETILMGMLYGAQVQTMMPKLHSTNFEGMELIRPLYLVREDDIKHWRDYNHLHFLQCACRFTETCSTCSVDGSSASKRMEIKHLIAKLKETNPYVEGNIFKSVENVNLSTVIAYKENGVKHHFLESYDEKA
jgi:tRNA 2-thiocytidine biosynthesis protein TtcA